MASHPPDVKWDRPTSNHPSPQERERGQGQEGSRSSTQRWCFYNVTLPYPELSWIETTQVAADALDEVVGAVYDGLLVRTGVSLGTLEAAAAATGE